MESETPKATVSLAPQPNPAQGAKSPTDFGTLFSEATKYTVFAVFALYSIGFLVWHAYLSKFGITSVGFLQTEYLSAAICFLMLMVAFGLPPALLYERWIKRNQSGKKTVFDFAFVVMLAWIVMWWLFAAALFPSDFAALDSTRRIARWLIVAFFPYSGLWFYLFIKARKIKPLLPTLETLNPINVLIFSLWGAQMLSLFLSSLISQTFLLMAIITVLGVLYGIHTIRDDWAHVSLLSKGLLGCGVLLAVIFNALLFGEDQFGKIDRSMGGGKPETAYLKFSPQAPELASALSLTVVTNFPTLNGFFGPVSVLLRSEKELFLVNFAETSIPEFATNRTVIAVITNISSGWSTNLLSNITTNGNGQKVTNNAAMPEKSVTNETTVRVWEDHLKNPARLTAKQVRSELIDVVIYAK